MKLKFQTTVFGQLVRIVSHGRLLRYPDEIDSSLWKKAVDEQVPQLKQVHEHTQDTEHPNDAEEGSKKNLEPFELQSNVPQDNIVAKDEPDTNVMVVNWYGPDDPENPQNWPENYKHLIFLQLCFLNFAVYIASSIYVPGEPDLMEGFGVSKIVATLGLSLFTIGYGMGPMLWSPLSEMPKLGRSAIFFWTLFAFIILQLPVGFAPNVSVFFFFRWLTGFCGSPCLSTGGGVITDIYAPTKVPYCLCIWAAAGVLGPILGPLIGGYLAPSVGWRWTIWTFTCICSLVLVVMFFLFPETSAANILYKRAKRLRKATGIQHLRSQSEIESAHYTPKDNLRLVGKAFTLTFMEPVVLLINLFAGLLYGVLFTWFESFPLVFGDIYHFNPGQQGLVFIGILVFSIIALPLFLLWIKLRLVPAMTSGNFKPEMVLPPTTIGAAALPICLFWFGWTSREDLHWILPIVGSGFFAIGIITLFNSLYMYLGIVYAQHAASIFAGAALFRASFGATFPLFAPSLFARLGIGPGNSLLGGIAVLFFPIPFVFYRYGERLRGWKCANQ
ncbi:MFS general substrate transporter [Periconia macrospinosa]|uniref:MFS general substrate transporter n=1 Tax=Periconia macrospinosa TaxID=97972 RepID=A0A2V1D9P9_9PLEO|nr:MFS general substrate transporter [Periconia macrospinosa]